MRLRSSAAAALLAATLGGAADAAAAEPASSAAPASSVAPKEQEARRGQGVAVLAVGEARADAFALARAIYASPLRPRRLDKARARVLAGNPPPPGAPKEVRELGELRASLTGADNAPSRRILGAIADDLGVEALLVVSRAAPAEAPVDPAGDAGTDTSAAAPGASAAAPGASARLFLAGSGELDAARYEPEASSPDAPWRGVVRSLAPRFPPPPPSAGPPRAQPVPARLPLEPKDSKPFYASTWFWAAVAGAAAVGALIFFVTQDTSSDPNPS